MAEQGIRSRPIYERLRLDRSGLRHLLVVDAPSYPVETLAAEPAELEVWSVAPRESQGISGGAPTGGGCSFRSVRLLLERLTHRLREESMGLRLYAAGQEGFLWDVHGVAERAGLGKREVFLAHHGSLRRRVLCVHCRTFNEGVTTTITPCQGCGAQLFVRDHFSRRHAAFMGFKIDAEQPGDVPVAEQAYP